MIITCPNCNKQFKIDNSLIPDEGRDLQCGSCNHIWFFKFEEQNVAIDNNQTSYLENTKTQEITDKKELQKKIDKIINTKDTALVKYNKKNNFSLVKVFRYFLVLIISFISIIIILDTFKYPLGKYFPNLEFHSFRLLLQSAFRSEVIDSSASMRAINSSENSYSIPAISMGRSSFDFLSRFLASASKGIRNRIGSEVMMKTHPL